MKKLAMFSIFILGLFFVFGCGTEEEQQFSRISNPDEKIFDVESSASNAAMQEIYENLRSLDDSAALNIITRIMADDHLNLSDEYNMVFFNQILNELFTERILENSDYLRNGIFDEQVAALDLQRRGFNIICEEATSYNIQKDLVCNFDDYIKSTLEIEVLEKMLVVEFIIQEQQNIIENFPVVRVEHFQMERGSMGVFESRQKLIEFLNDFEAGIMNDFSELDSILNLDDLLEITENFNNILNPTNNNYFSALNSFIRCGDHFCDVFEGFQFQINEVNEISSTSKSFINRETSDFSTNISNMLFSENVEDYLIEIGGHNYLVAPFSNLENLSLEDAVIYEQNNQTFYLIRVERIDESSSLIDYLNAVYTLSSKVQFQRVFEHFASNYDFEFFEKIIEESISSRIGS